VFHDVYPFPYEWRWRDLEEPMNNPNEIMERMHLALRTIRGDFPTDVEDLGGAEQVAREALLAVDGDGPPLYSRLDDIWPPSGHLIAKAAAYREACVAMRALWSEVIKSYPNGGARKIACGAYTEGHRRVTAAKAELLACASGGHVHVPGGPIQPEVGEWETGG
jgi:hypothetical protein